MVAKKVKMTSEEKVRKVFLGKCEKALLKKRSEVLSLKKALEKSHREILCDADVRDSESSNNVSAAEQLHTLKKPAQLSGVLKAIDRALERIYAKDPTYGFCEDCGEGIPIARLTTVPWTKHCVECKTKEERKKHPHVNGGGIKRDFAPQMRVF